MRLMPPTDAMFLLGESRDVPTHVGGLQLFEAPDGAGPSEVREIYERLVSVEEVRPLFRRRAVRSLTTLGQWAWEDEGEDVDLEYHVRHSALPAPGRIRELLTLGSRLHSTLLDRHRPLWEFHLIEGLEADRYAAYTKVHHSLIDGVSALRLLERSLSEDPDDGLRPPWAATGGERPRPAGEGGPVQAIGDAVGTVRDLLGVGPALLRSARRSLADRLAAHPFQAPPTMFNVGITGSRRFAADGWSLERVRRVGTATGTTVNDVVLALCGGALRRYLTEHSALPDDPLIAMVPVSLRQDDAAEGNAVGAVLCNLATDLADPAARLDAVHASMRNAKANLEGLDQLQATLLSAAVMAPMALRTLVHDAPGRPPFNLVVSNVPGPRHTLYAGGAELLGVYPMSIPTHGQALNITITSYVDELQFGIVGCRRSVPHLQRLLAHLDESLQELEAAAAVA